MAVAERGQGSAPRPWAAEVRYHHHETRLARDPPQPGEGPGETALVALLVGGHPLGEHQRQPDERSPTAPRWQEAVGGAAGGQERDAATAADRQPADDRDDPLGDIRLEPVGGPEGHGGRDVQRHPCGQQALGHVEAYVGDPRARGRGRVELSDVVAGLVGAQLRQLGPHAHTGRGPLAGEPRPGPPRHDEVERVHQPRRHRPGALPPGGQAHGRRLGHAA
jgi:hypothetical protein